MTVTEPATEPAAGDGVGAGGSVGGTFPSISARRSRSVIAPGGSDGSGVGIPSASFARPTFP